MTKKKYLKDKNGITRALATNELGLEKPLGNENYDVNIFNNNMDKIDVAIKNVKNDLSNIDITAERVEYNKNECSNVDGALDKLFQSDSDNKTSISSLRTKVDNGQNFKLTTDNGSFIRLEDRYNIDTILSGNYDISNATGTLPSGLNSSNNNIFIETKRRGDDFLRQVVYDVRSLNSWERIRKSNAWQSWRQINGGQNLKLTHDDGSYIQTRDTGNVDIPVLGWFNYYNAKGTLPDGYSPTNNDILIENRGVNTNWIRQTLYDVRSFKKFERMRLNGSWSDWREL